MGKKMWNDIEPTSIKTHQRRCWFKNDIWLYESGVECCDKRIINQPCVYVIYLDGEIGYIGQSNKPKFRFCQHGFQKHQLFKTPWGNFTDMYAKIKYPSKYGMEAMLEKRLIKRLQPRFNRNFYKKETYCGAF